MILPTLAIALPLAATIERLQSQATAETMGERFVTAAVARGVPPGRRAVAPRAEALAAAAWRPSSASSSAAC